MATFVCPECNYPCPEFILCDFCWDEDEYWVEAEE